MKKGGGCEAFDLTRRRGGAEEDAETTVEKKGRINAFFGRFAETAENAEARRPSFARMDKAEPYPTGWR
jgi:hypothetical protein